MAAEEKKEDASLRLIIGDPKKMKPPCKKKFEEELESMQSQIKDKETKYERLKANSNEIKNVEYERKAAIDHRKRIVLELEKLNRDIPEKMRRLNELKSSLVYKSEDKINNAISRLEWNLSAKTFKLTEEKKIVSEIDRLKRSKKTLGQYQTLEQEINGIRGRQRAMRDERDRYSRTITQLKAKDDAMRQDCHKSKCLKQEIDDLYEQKRQLVASFKRQKEEFKDVKDKQRKESMKKKEEERKANIKVKRKERIEMEAEKLPHADELHLCQTLISYLSRFGLSMQDTGHEGLSPASSQGQSEDPEPAEEMDDGQFVLLRKTEENEDLDFIGLSRNRRRNRRSRKQSMIKKITHSTDVLSQFMTLNLNAPSSQTEVAEAIEELRKKRAFYEGEQQLMESASDAGFSLTESMICEMSRQASKTESCEGGSQENVRPDESVYTDLLEACKDNSDGLHSGCDELLGAVGGVPESEGSDSATPKSGSQNSDSTVEGEACSQGSQIFVNPPILRAADSGEIENKKKSEQKRSLSPQSNIPSPAPWLLGTSTARPEIGPSQNFLTVPKPESVLRQRTDTGQTSHQPLQKTFSVQPSSPSRNQDIKSYAHSVVSRSQSFSGAAQLKRPQTVSPQKQQSPKPSPPSSLLLSVPLSSSLSLSSPTKRPLTRSKTMTPTGGNPWKDRGAWNVKGETSKPLGTASLLRDRLDNKPLSLSPSMSHPLHSPLSPRHSCPLPSDSPMALQTTTTVLDQDFPPLSQTTNPSRRSSNLSSKSSSGSQSCVDIPHDIATGKPSPSSAPSLSKNILQPPPGTTNITTLQGSDFPPLQAGSVNLGLLPSVNPVPGKGKTDTELWVESSMAFVQDEVIEPESDSFVRESTRL